MKQRFSSSILRKDEAFRDLSALAARIHHLRKGRGLQLAGVNLGLRGAYDGGPAVEINALDHEGNPHERIGYAFIEDRVGRMSGRQAVEALQRAIDGENGRALVADPDVMDGMQ